MKPPALSRRSVLIIDDEKDVLYSFGRILAGEDYEVLTADNGAEGVALFRDRRPDLVLLDVRMAEMGGLEAMRAIHQIDPKALVIIMTAYATTQTAIEAMKAGAYDYVLKPFDIQEMKLLIQNALRSSESMKSVVSYQPLLSREDHSLGIIGKSRAMQRVYKEIGRVAARNVPVLITGETGTGKELVARAIYHHSDRHDRRFVAVNCSAIPETLLESELFGHERGAFTGAHARRLGKFEVCNGGTLFLDEIGELSPTLQAKLLRVLQEREIERLGGSEVIPIDVRVLAATNRDLAPMIAAGRFREDLYYRLNVVTLRLPPLRERKEDIPLLVEYFLARFQPDLGGSVTVSQAAIRRLEDHDWPGNVRELENVIKSSLLRLKGRTLLPEDLNLGAGDVRASPGRAPAEPSPPPAPTAGLDGLMRDVFEEVRRLRGPKGAEDAFTLVERALIREALIHVRGNQVQAARLLGIARSTLRKRMARYGIQVEPHVETGKAP